MLDFFNFIFEHKWYLWLENKTNFMFTEVPFSLKDIFHGIIILFFLYLLFRIIRFFVRDFALEFNTTKTIVKVKKSYFPVPVVKLYLDDGTYVNLSIFETREHSFQEGEMVFLKKDGLTASGAFGRFFEYSKWQD